MKTQIIILKKFPTHVKKSANKYWKVNNQAIYNGAINRFTRAVVVNNMHEYIINSLPNNLKIEDVVTVDIIIKTVINHGSIRRLKDGRISWKEPLEDYEPNWDEDNLTALWTKTIRDSLTKKAIITDDNVSVIRGGYRGIEFVDNIEDREIIITIKKL